jgi:putative ABC transport system permease protein
MSFFLETVWLGLKNLRLHMLRSILTALGIVCGVAAVIMMVAVGEGTKRQTLQDIERLGARNIIIRSQRPPESASAGGEQRQGVIKYGLKHEDMRRLEAAFPGVEHIIPLKQIGSELLRNDRKMNAQAYGTVPELADVANLRIARGRYLLDYDLDRRAKVAVIGHEIANLLFPLEDPIGKTFRIDQQVLTVVGILSPVGLAGGAGSALVGRDLNKDIHLPLTTASTIFGDMIVQRQSGSFQASEVELSEIYLASASRDMVLLDAARARRVVDVGHAGKSDVAFIVPYELLESARKTTLVFNAVLTVIAAVGLLVGGIGIMNIMLATVTERTREIGIRRALGATRNNITIQFLIETGVLSMAGGVVGIIAGISLSFGLEALMGQWSRVLGEDASVAFYVTGWSVVVSFLVAAATGLVFGLYPARVAARQDPIVALRHD